MRNGLRSAAIAVALIAGVVAAGAQGTSGQSTPKQDEAKQKVRPQRPAPAQVQERRELPKQGITRTQQSGGERNRLEPRKQVEPRKQAVEPRGQVQQQRERSVEQRQPREQASNRGSFNPEQRTRIRAGFERHRVAPASVDFSIGVGRNVPNYVRTYPVPEDVWSIWPEYRRYVYIWVGDEILVINPRTHRIVAILEA